MSIPAFLVVQEASGQTVDCYTQFIFHWFTLNPVLECFEDRLDSGGFESTVCTNNGTGQGLICDGGNVQLKSLLEGSGIDITTNADDITIASTIIDTNFCTSTGTGEAVCESANNINSLIGGTSISIADTVGDLTITNTSPEATVCTNTGTGVGICNGGNVNLNSLIGSTGISVANTTDDLTITNTSPESTTCTDTGSGVGICNGGNTNLNSLIASTGISIANTTDDLTITNTSPEATVCSNSGTGEGTLCNGGNVTLKSLKQGTGITLTNNANDVTITSSGGSNALLDGSSHTDTTNSAVTKGDLIFGNSTPAWDDLAIGASGQQMLVDANGLPSWSFGRLAVATSSPYTVADNHTIVECQPTGAGTITIVPPTIPTNQDKRLTIIKNSTNSGLCVIDPAGSVTINGQATYTLTNKYEYITLAGGDFTTDWLIISQGKLSCSNTGSGNGLCDTTTSIDTIAIKSLIAGAGITITDTTNDWTIASALIGQMVGQVSATKTMTNIGTTNVDIYTAAFDEEDMMMIDCTNITDFRIVYMWDYVGAGTHTIRWVDVANNSNVLYTTTRTSDADAIDSGWFTKPAFCSGVITFEQQGSSTTGTDDPIAKGYVIYAR